jgi:hypothetical protein
MRGVRRPDSKSNQRASDERAKALNADGQLNLTTAKKSSPSGEAMAATRKTNAQSQKRAVATALNSTNESVAKRQTKANGQQVLSWQATGSVTRMNKADTGARPGEWRSVTEGEWRVQGRRRQGNSRTDKWWGGGGGERPPNNGM